MKLLNLITLSLFLSFCHPVSQAYSEDYSFYAKSGLGYILDQPDKHTVHFDDGGKLVQKLYYSEGDNYSHSFEAGMTRGNWNMGIAFTGLIDQGESKKHHKPYKLELFSDYKQHIQNSVYTTVGFGFKLLSDETLRFENGYVQKFSPKDKLLDKFTARIGIFKSFKKYEIGLVHHSQWFVGVPFNDDWEYHKTEIVFNKYFF